MKKINRTVEKEQSVRLSEIVKKSALKCQTSFDLQKLAVPLPVFVPLVYQEALEIVQFTYDLTGMNPVSELEKEEKSSQYQFLINFKMLFDAWRSYDIPMSSNNIFYDENFLPYVKFRDLYVQAEAKNSQEFLTAYKSFIGGILGKKYTIHQIQDSGLEILKKKSYFADYYGATSNEALVAILRQNKKEHEINQRNTTQVVSKGSYRFRSRLAFIAPLLLLVAVIALTHSNTRVIPNQEKVITAHEAYIRRDFDGVTRSLTDMSVDEMSVSTKYILAISYARGNNLHQEEITAIVSRISLQSDERELEYWIYLGRNDAVRAQERAMSLSDDQLLIYAYMTELNLLESDMTIPGYEKRSRIDTLESNIRNLGNRFTVELLEDEDIDEDEEDVEDVDENDQESAE